MATVPPFFAGDRMAEAEHLTHFGHRLGEMGLRPRLSVTDGKTRSVASYAAHARANASVCSLGKDPLADVTSSRVCLPPYSLTNESSQCVSGPLVKAILTVCCSGKSVIDN
jgi:hypothetical protein